MSVFSQAESLLSAAQFDIMSDDGLYDGVTSCRVIVDKETLWLETDEGASSREQVSLAFLLSEVNPARGKVVVVNGKSYKLGRRIRTTPREAIHLVSK